MKGFKDFVNFCEFEIRYFILLALLTLLAMCSGCRSSKSTNLSYHDINDSTSTVESSFVSSSVFALAESLTMNLDSLDIWIYDELPEYYQFCNRPDSAVSTAVRQSVHISAKKGSFAKNFNSDKSVSDKGNFSFNNEYHGETTETIEKASDATAVADPPKWGVLIFVVSLAVIEIAVAFWLYRKRDVG